MEYLIPGLFNVILLSREEKPHSSRTTRKIWAGLVCILYTEKGNGINASYCRTISVPQRKPIEDNSLIVL